LENKEQTSRAWVDPGEALKVSATLVGKNNIKNKIYLEELNNK
jgi:hypothetical protein